MNIYSGCCEPLSAVGDAKCACFGTEGRKSGSQACVGKRFCGQPSIVMRFGKVDKGSIVACDFVAYGKVVVQLRAIVDLENFRVGPVQVGLVQ